MIYESADYHNAVFVGYDMDGIPRHAHKRGTGSESTYKGNADGSFRITNTAMDKWMQFDENYDSFGSYANERGIMPCLFKKN